MSFKWAKEHNDVVFYYKTMTQPPNRILIAVGQ